MRLINHQLLNASTAPHPLLQLHCEILSGQNLADLRSAPEALLKRHESSRLVATEVQ